MSKIQGIKQNILEAYPPWYTACTDRYYTLFHSNRELVSKGARLAHTARAQTRAPNAFWNKLSILMKQCIICVCIYVYQGG